MALTKSAEIESYADLDVVYENPKNADINIINL